MASSSSRSTPASSSSSPSWNHDVFLSFRGEDTRKTFVGHLYSALEKQGIITYKDDETLPRGESIGPSLSKAIQESRIAVIVFSENYADSSWCLDELAYVMKCKDERGQIVMPIFYHVDPSEVRKQKRKYGEAFVKHELENNNKVESWRKALVDASNLAGWEPKHVANGHEAKCIEEIVDTISSRLLSLVSNVNQDLVGMEARLQDLKSQLEIGSGGVRMVGIWGVGGGGKTTLASSVYLEISHQFEGHCLVENVREESSKYGLKKLQEKILSDVLKTEVVVKSVVEGRCTIKRRLCGKNVFIVLDDVDDLDQLEALVGSHDWFGAGSRIIITTRDKHLLETHKVDVIYGVSLLSRGEAIQLFRRHAYREDKPVEDYDKLSLDVVSYADGLPLALKILGSFLYDKDKNEWMSALAKLKHIPNPRITDKLKISYDGLQQDEKELFLDIACFFRGKEKYEAMIMFDACGFHPVIGVKVLVQKALITIQSDGRFDMHDLVQELACYIVRGKYPKNPEKHSRVWRYEDILNICALDSTTEHDKIEALTLMFNRLAYPPEPLPQHLPEVVANMNKLRLISWTRYGASSLPTSFQPKKLCYLSLEFGLIKQLWEGYKRLPSLKVLDLTFSCNLIRTPDFEGLPCLERLILMGCVELEEIHSSIGYHEGLVFLDMTRCSKLKMFPPIIRMRRLETLDLSHCDELRKFPEIQMNMDSLVNLHLNSTGIEIVPSSIGQYCTNLVSLDLSFCRDLKSIEGNFRLLKRLKTLGLNCCDGLEEVAYDLFEVDCCLEVPFLPSHGHSDVSYIGRKFPNFPRFLRRLDLGWCNLVDGDIPSNICELSNLQILDLRGNKFSRLHSSLSQLPRLKSLNIKRCPHLVELPDLPSSIASLDASECDSLEIVGDLPTKYKWLWKVSLRREKRMIGDEKVLQSMLQGNAIEDHFMSLKFGGYRNPTRSYKWETYRLQLPHNWYKDFSGFLICVACPRYSVSQRIIIKQEMHMENQSNLLEVFDKTPEIDTMWNMGYREMAYISFGSLRHTSWWNSTYSQISFFLKKACVKVELVSRKRKGDSTEKAKGGTYSSEFWDEEVEELKTFTIEPDSKSFIEIFWHHWLSHY